MIETIAEADGVLVSGGGTLCSRWPEHLFERIALQVAVQVSGELTKLSGRVNSVVLSILDAREVAWLTAKAALVVSSRYHPVVFALAHGVQTLGIFADSYTRVKIRGALAHANLERFCISWPDAIDGQLSLRRRPRGKREHRMPRASSPFEGSGNRAASIGDG